MPNQPFIPIAAKPEVIRFEAPKLEIQNAEVKPAAPPPRLVSLDAYRGFIMLLMASSGFAVSKVVKEHPELLRDSAIWRGLNYQLDHVAWTGCGLWDLIQPAFMFMVGVAIPYSYASRKAKGDSEGKILRHTFIRALVLVLLGVFLTSNWSRDRHTDIIFTNVLCQIGLGYFFVYLLRGRGLLLQGAVMIALLVGTWFAFYQHPVAGPDFDFAAVHAPPETRFTGLYAHWDKNANVASAFEKDFLNLFRRSEPMRFDFAGQSWESEVLMRGHGPDGKDYRTFEYNEGGYATLSFIPSMATMILGLMAGELLRSRRRAGAKFILLVLAGVFCLAVGMLLDYTIWPDRLSFPKVNPESTQVGLFHVCPIVKRIWTPSWAIFSGGWTLLMLAGFYGVIDLIGFKRWAFPLVVVGMNSIAIYCMSQLLRPWLRNTLQIHFGHDIFGGMYGPIIEVTAILLCLWVACYWMYRQRIFVRI